MPKAKKTRLPKDFETLLEAGDIVALKAVFATCDPDAERDRAARVVADVRTRDGAGDDLCELAVQWVKLNPTPAPLTPPNYKR